MAKKQQRCRWYAGKIRPGVYQVLCLVPSRGKYGKPKGAPRRWKLAVGPYRSRRAAVEATYAMYG